jgi:hypothetical protein
MKYFLLITIFTLTSCSLDKNSTYWNDNLKELKKVKKLPNVSKKTTSNKTMTFEEFNLFLNDYSDRAEYPDINN